MSALPTVDELAEKISDELGYIQSVQEIAAQLESLGFSDDDARNVYARQDVFGLAEDVVAVQRDRPDLLERAGLEEDRRIAEEGRKGKASKLLYLRHIIRGLAYGMPMGVMLAASVLLLYSLWSYYYFSPAQATAIGIGTALSYFIAGGFTQAIGRRGLMYLRQDLFLMTLKVSWFFILSGLVVTVLLAATIYVVFNFFGVISVFEVNIAVIYFVTLSILWLCLAMLYMLEQELVFTVAVAFGIAVVYLVREYVDFGLSSDWDMVVAHQIGLIAASIFSIVASAQHLLRKHYKHRQPGQKSYSKLPRVSMLFASVRTYLLYGTLYFTLLFSDRLLAWTGRMEFRQTFIWFRADYEAGLNWALIGMLPAFAVLEIVIQRFGAAMKPRQLRHAVQHRRDFCAWYMRFYTRQVIFYVIVAILGVLFVWWGGNQLIDRVPELRILETDVPRFTFWVGAVGYLSIGFALLNLSVFFWLSRPRLAMISLVPAMATNLVVGYLLSRIVSYHFAVFGLATGGLLFALISTVLCLRVMANLDYYYYSAF